MSEFSSPPEDGRFHRIFGAAALAFGILASGLAVKVAHEAFKSPPGPSASATPSVAASSPFKPLRPCYGASIKHLLPPRTAPKLPPLKIQNQGGVADGDPGMLKTSIREKVFGASIRIQNIGRASGFLLESDVAVVAAHSAYTRNIQNITITDRNNHTSNIIDGCYVYEKNGQQRNPLGKEGHLDVAVLKLAKPLGTATLPLADFQPNRGDWVTFLNYQNSRTERDPAEYNGIVLADKSDIIGNIILTGVQGWRGCELQEDKKTECAIEGGASGGPVVDWNTGSVVGISVRGTGQGRLSPAEMENYGAAPQFDIGPGSGFQPRIAYTTEANAIQLAFNALG